MVISDIAVKRPVMAAVVALILIAFGVVAFNLLPLRQYPDVDPPVVSVETAYPGASANVVENRITELIEERISGVEGIAFIESVSRDGESDITIEFNIDRNVESAANDIRDRVSGILDDLPEEADPPEIQKVDGDSQVIVWLNLVSPTLTVPELTDYAERFLVDRFSILDGVARVRIGGQQSYAMRVWLDREALAARNLTANDVENALRAENVELPGGSIESKKRQFTVRVERSFRSAEDFASLVLRRGDDGYLIRLGDVARVEKGTVEDRSFFRGNSVPMVGLGIIKQSTANTIAVATAAKEAAARINPTLPDGMELKQSFDTSVFINGAIQEVYKTLFIAMGLVIVVILVFLGSVRAMLVPAVTVPVSIISTFIVLYALGFTINLLTLLALVLAIGLVVDDAIVVLENISRRIRDLGETPLVAAYRGARQVGFAVIATTLVLVAVFVPITFLQGDVGRLFSEFALTMAAAVCFSSLIALTTSPMIASKVLKASDGKPSKAQRLVDRSFQWIREGYATTLRWALSAKLIVALIFAGTVAGTAWLYTQIPTEFSPREDRGAFFVIVNGPEGASYSYMSEYMDEVEQRLMPYVESGEFQRLLVRAPRGFGTFENFNTGFVIVVLGDWNERRNAFTIMGEVRKKLSDLPGIRAFPVMRQAFASRVRKPLEVTIGGGSWAQLTEWRDKLLAAIQADNPGLVGIDWDYKETQPQLRVEINYDRAAELGVTVSNIGRTLQTMLGSRRVTTYTEGGEEYDVIVEGERARQRTPTSLQNIYVRSARTNELIPLSNFVTLREEAGSKALNRYNRIRAITIEANLANGLALGDALAHVEAKIAEVLPPGAIIDYKGRSLDLKNTGQSIIFVFALGIVVVFLVLAAQFESFVHPFVIMLTVPVAVGGALVGLWLTGNTLNIYSQIGLIMLVGLAAKNGILIVEFANQLRDEGRGFAAAIEEAAATRLRPIIMTGITTAAGAIPLIASFGAGAETRMVIGVVVLAGVIAATVMTLYIIPVAYAVLARGTLSPSAVAQRLEREAGHSQRAPSGDSKAPYPAE
ncbi:MAG: efflux RND transporter permease subunit [Pseudomonadota bacterium]